VCVKTKMHYGMHSVHSHRNLKSRLKIHIHSGKLVRARTFGICIKQYIMVHSSVA
jgi:hypothetical protein